MYQNRYFNLRRAIIATTVNIEVYGFRADGKHLVRSEVTAFEIPEDELEDFMMRKAAEYADFLRNVCGFKLVRMFRVVREELKEIRKA